jgi:hypothetical protein
VPVRTGLGPDGLADTGSRIALRLFGGTGRFVAFTPMWSRWASSRSVAPDVSPRSGLGWTARRPIRSELSGVTERRGTIRPTPGRNT